MLAEEKPEKEYKGTGVVMAAGGKYLRYAYASLSILRELDPEIPVQIWTLKGEQPDSRFDHLNVEWVESEPYFEYECSYLRTGWASKCLAVKHSPFRHVLLLDADSAPVKAPADLFESYPYRSTGLVLFPDVAEHTHSGFWPSIGIRYKSVPEHEAGQVLIDKNRHWETLKLTMWMNCHKWFHDTAFGDKNLWGIAATKLKIPYSNGESPRWAGWGIEHFLEGELAFQHLGEEKRNGRHRDAPTKISSLLDEYDFSNQPQLTTTQ